MLRTGASFLVMAVAMGAFSAGLASAAGPPPSGFPLLSDDEAWSRLPQKVPRLPAWVRALTASLPRTTAAMLQLDYLHRVNNPLGPALAGRLRWAVADAIGCDYARRYAEADLRRAGVWNSSRTLLLDRSRRAGDPEQKALTFARKLTRAAYSVTDEEVADLVEHLGPEKVVAMVHTIAHANFQTRIFLALGIEVEPGGPLAPLQAPLDPTRSSPVPAPARPAWPVGTQTLKAGADVRPDWAPQTFTTLEKALERQKSRKGRIPLPGPEQLARIPPEAKAQASRVIWTKISMGYQPLLTKSWFDCMRTFQQEARLDPVFGNTLFWVITRSNECFY